MMAPKKGEKDQHIQVSVRCRPLNSIERRQCSYSVVETVPEKREVVVKEKIGINPHTKTFSFDHVFSAHTPQIDVYKGIVTPIIEEVLLGYNCTVFAYGQTGTGKTFTMEGERTEDVNISWEEDPLAGIIPRAMHNMFERLQSSDVEFSVRVSFLELYNEELFDLLGSGDDTLRLKIYEDGTKKGSVVIQGLEEVVVNNKNEVYHILERGSAKRQTAATMMNAHSSRSHTVFSAIIHTKENSIDGEELLKTGKLNLVDLAGSENIGRSGAVDKRAREAGNINQSLLTLGRVITALVEHAPHIPYRESKLTRLLQDSLGGKTKTSIIATISPASCNLEETLSTLDYAHRAKNIQNKPEINQKLTKKALLKEYTGEIERLKKDLQAAREKNGVYLAEENYTAMQATMTQQSESIKELEERIALMTEEMTKINDLFTETQDELVNTKNELDSTKQTLKETSCTLEETRTDLQITKVDRDEQRHLVDQHVEAENLLYSEANQLLQTANLSTTDVFGLHDKLDRKRKVESHNEQCQQNFMQHFTGEMVRIKDTVHRFKEKQHQTIEQTRQHLSTLLNKSGSEVESLQTGLSALNTAVEGKLSDLDTHMKDNKNSHSAEIGGIMEMVKKRKEQEVEAMTKFEKDVFRGLVSSLDGILKSAQTCLQNFSQDFQSQLSVLETEEKEYTETLQQDLDKLSVSVDKYIQTTNAQVSEMTAQREKAREKEQQFDQLVDEKLSELQGLLKQRQNHFTTYSQEEEAFSDNIKENLSSISSVKQEIQSCSTISQTHQEEFLSCTSSHRTSSLEFVTKVQEKLSTCSQSGENIVKETSEFNDRCKQGWSAHCTSVCDKLQEHNTSLITELNVNYHKTQAIQRCVSDSIQSLTSVVNDHSDQMKEAIGQMDTDWVSTTEEVTTFSETLKDNLSKQDSSLSTFLSEEIQKDIPTGLTPQRREFPYPQDLSKTEPHDILLERFRSRREKDQVVVTLFEDEDDSQLSMESEQKTPDAVIEEEVMLPPKSLPDNTDAVSEAGSDVSTKSGMSSKENRFGSTRSTRSKSSTKGGKPGQKTPVYISNSKSRLPLRASNTPQH